MLRADKDGLIPNPARFRYNLQAGVSEGVRVFDQRRQAPATEVIWIRRNMNLYTASNKAIGGIWGWSPLHAQYFADGIALRRN